jgi:hypothetical protein
MAQSPLTGSYGDGQGDKSKFSRSTSAGGPSTIYSVHAYIEEKRLSYIVV